MAKDVIEYTGTKQPTIDEVRASGDRLRPYIPNPDLVEAVNLAIFLGRPLLLRGEPGCGKSLLASAVAFELSLSLEIWSIRSTTRAVDGLYFYDSIARLRDAQLAALDQRPSGANASESRPVPAGKYVRLGPVGRAFSAEARSVLLIDEIDKADIDFPNDILDIIEYPTFKVEETGDEIRAKHQPIIVITSNDEKELPDAFLRRCLFAYIAFPDHERLTKILDAHFGGPPAEIVERAVRRFVELRGRQEQESYGAIKKVSTSELIDWMRVILRDRKDANDKLADGQPYPYKPVLIKRREDIEFAEKPMGRDKSGPDASTDSGVA